MRKWTIGVDFGGTNVKVGLVGPNGHVVRRRVIPSGEHEGPARFIEDVGKAAEELTRAVGARPSQLLGLGVGAPGPVDVERGVVRSLVNVPGWEAVPLRRRLERRVRCRCAVDNDANLFALGEWRFGAGRGFRHLVGMTLGTGVGGGLILNGILHRGTTWAAGEIGHMVVHPAGPRCGCGGRGCLEAYVGTAAILRMARRAIRQSTGPLRTLAAQAGGRMTPALIHQAARRGDAAAQQIWVEVGCWLGVAMANLVKLLGPDLIVIGGGVARAWRWFSPSMLRAIRGQAQRFMAEEVRVVQGRLGDDAAMVGAAVLVWDTNR